MSRSLWLSAMPSRGAGCCPASALRLLIPQAFPQEIGATIGGSIPGETKTIAIAIAIYDRVQAAPGGRSAVRNH